MGAEPQRPMTPQEYLAFEREAEEKHEYWDGEIVAMTGASPGHNAICFNLAGALKPRLRGSGCRGFTSDQRLRVPLSNRYIYPDLTVVCGQPVFEDDDPYTLVNPTLVVEVLSSTTESKDWGSKLFGYRTLPSLRGYLLVAQDRTWVEHWSRQDDGRWLVTEIDDPAVNLELPEVGCKLPLAEIYEDVELAPPLVTSYVDPDALTDEALAELRRFLHRLGREGRQGEVGAVIGGSYYGITEFDPSEG